VQHDLDDLDVGRTEAGDHGGLDPQLAGAFPCAHHQPVPPDPPPGERCRLAPCPPADLDAPCGSAAAGHSVAEERSGGRVCQDDGVGLVDEQGGRHMGVEEAPIAVLGSPVVGIGPLGGGARRPLPLDPEPHEDGDGCDQRQLDEVGVRLALVARQEQVRCPDDPRPQCRGHRWAEAERRCSVGDRDEEEAHRLGRREGRRAEQAGSVHDQVHAGDRDHEALDDPEAGVPEWRVARVPRGTADHPGGDPEAGTTP
jgi:hypothetical protein